MKVKRNVAMESVPLKRQRSHGDWSDTRVKIGKSNGHDRLGVEDKRAGHVDWGGGEGGRPERDIENTLKPIGRSNNPKMRMRSASPYHFQCEDRLTLPPKHCEVEVRA